MDFSSVLSAQIARSKQETPADKKYIKRSEVEAQRQAAYLAEQKALEAARIEKFERKRKLDEEEELRALEREEKKRKLAEESRRRREEEEQAEERDRRKRLGLPDLEGVNGNGGGGNDGGSSHGKDIPDEELDVKLRELGEKTKISDETHEQRLHRYYKLMNRSSSPTLYSDGPIPTKLKLVSEKKMKVAKGLPKSLESRHFLSRQLVSYFNMVLKEWEIALSQRDDGVKASFQGKAAFNAMIQARESMRPLFRKLEKNEVEDGILEPILEIVNAAQERRYVDANDGYLRLSIGKAAWPIGVTMVGIHERSAREKLHESDKGAAHIMSDETTRKFLQSIKRCLSFAQTRWPPDDQMQLMGSTEINKKRTTPVKSI